MKKILLTTLFLASCKAGSEFKRNLALRNDNEFWILKKKGLSGLAYQYAQWRFDADGTCMQYYSPDERKKGYATLVSIEGNAKPQWHYAGKDGVFEMSYHNSYKVTSFTKDTILMDGIDVKGHFALVRSAVK